jgi:hypothetical protein
VNRAKTMRYNVAVIPDTDWFNPGVYYSLHYFRCFWPRERVAQGRAIWRDKQRPKESKRYSISTWDDDGKKIW